MKWDKADKKRLQDLIGIRLEEIANRKIISYGLPKKLRHLLLNERDVRFACFFVEFGIKYCPYPTKRKNCVVVANPWFGPPAPNVLKAGLSIPKDVALKFLVLGIP